MGSMTLIIYKDFVMGTEKVVQNGYRNSKHTHIHEVSGVIFFNIKLTWGGTPCEYPIFFCEDNFVLVELSYLQRMSWQFLIDNFLFYIF